MTTSMEVAAALASTILIKGGVVVGVALLGARFGARTASGASLFLGLGLGALGVGFLLGPLLPELNPGFLTISHGAVEGASIGSLKLSPALIFVVIWGIGALVMLARFVQDLRAATGLAGRANGQAGRRAEELLRRAAGCIGVGRPPELRETAELGTAALLGFRRPVLLIPVQSRAWSDAELFAVLCHELEHVRRNDWLMLMLERLVGAIYWINPLVFLARRSASAAREMAADDAALRAGTPPSVYARRLIAVARDLHNAPRLAVSVAFAEGARVDERVKALFDSRDRQPLPHPATFGAIVLATPFLVALAGLQLWSCLPS